MKTEFNHMQDVMHYYLHHLIFKENDMKTFELTQEQIDRLAEKKHAKELLQEFLPEAFETKLEVGRWYKLKDEPKILALYDCFKNHRPYVYIFNANGDYEYKVEFSLFELPTYWELASEEEVSEALINEFKKRLGKNKKVKTLKDKWEEPIIIEVNFEEFRYYSKENELWTSCKKTGIGYKVFNNGKWAEIIEEPEPTKEEISRVLTFLKNQNEQ